MAQSCVVTGGAGFIGCAISRHLLEHYGRVLAIDCLHPQIHQQQQRPTALAPGVDLVVGDVTAAETWDRVLQEVRPTTIVHLAAETGTGQSLTEAARHAHTNVCGTGVMLDALARHDMRPERIILTSSRAVYGEGAWLGADNTDVRYPGQRTREQLGRAEWQPPGWHPLPSSSAATRPVPVSVYGATKLTQEHLLSSWGTAFGVPTIVLRLQNVYGPGQSLTNSYTGIVSLFCRIAREGGRIPLYEDGRMLRDFVFIDDVVDALVAAGRLNVDGHCTFDVGTGVAITIEDLACRIADIYHAPAPHVCGKYRYGDVRHAICDVAAARTSLSWAASHDLSAGLATLSEWINQELD